ADALELKQELPRRRDVAAFTLNWFHNDSRYFLRIHNFLEEFALQHGSAFRAARLRSEPIRAPIGVGIWDVEHSSEQRAESLALNCFRRRERERTEGSSVETPVEGDELLAPGVVAREFDGCLNGLRAGVAEIDALRLFARRDSAELLRQLDQVWIIEIRSGNVNQLRGLFLDGRNNFRMAVARRDHCDARSEIEEYVAVHVLHHGAAASPRHQRVAARVGR